MSCDSYKWTCARCGKTHCNPFFTCHPREYEVVDTYFKDGLAVLPKVVNVPLYYLSQSLGKMAECDAVYLCDGWENARGCKVERAAAVAYDLELIGYDLPCRGDAS